MLPAETEISSVSLFGKYPRVIGHPVKVKIVYSMQQLNDYIKENISKLSIHLSLYSFRNIINSEYGNIQVDYQSADIDKIFFDIDEGNWIKQMQDLQNWCLEHNILHTYNLSSNCGGHFFIGCDPRIQYKKTAVRNFQNYMIKKLKLKIIQAEHGGGGITILGDIARTFRVPNTFNFKRGCYCVQITSDELKNLDKLDLKIITKSPRKIDTSSWHGEKLVDLQHFDKKEFMFDQAIRKVSIKKSELVPKETIENMIKKYKPLFPQCIQQFFNDPILGFYGRYLFVLYLRDQKYVMLTDNEIVSTLKSTLNEETWLHCATNLQLPGHHPGEKLLPIKLVLSNLSYKFPSCKQLQFFGMCPDKKKERCTRQWHPIF